MVGIAFEGGGTKGSYQIGAYMAFKKCHKKIDGVCGTSIGAFNAAMIASGKEKELFRFWQEEDFGKIMGFSEKYIKFMNEDDSSLVHNLLSKGKTFLEFSKSFGLKIDGLKNKLNEILSDEDVRNSKIDFGLCTISVNKLKPLYLFKEDIPKGKINDYILASCYLPIFKPSKLDNKYFLDGGIYDGSPSNMLERKGYKKIYVISCDGINVIQKKINKAQIITIKPSRKLGSIVGINKKQINNNIFIGYYDTLKVLKKLDGYKYIFNKRPNFYYNFISSSVDINIIKKISKIFQTKDNKEIIIYTIEHILKEEKKEYKIYNINKEIKRIKKIKNKNDIYYKFIKKLISF